MYSAANEEKYFRDWVGRASPRSPNGYTISYSRRKGAGGEAWWYKASVFDSQCPKARFETRPILTLTSYEAPPVPPVLVEQDYHGRKYVVGNPPGSEDESADGFDMRPTMTNKNVFTLLSYLFGASALEPDKLPIQQLIQVR